MFVKDYMTPHPILVEPTLKVTDAQRLMTENNIRHLPVVGDGKRLLGLVTRQRLSIPPDKLGSLDVWEITRYLSELTVGKVMITGKDLHTIGPEATIEEAADIMIQNKISGVPVVEDGGAMEQRVVVGILTETDLLIQLQNLLGAIDRGWRVTMHIPDRRGEYHKLTKAIADRGWGIMALGGVRAPKDPQMWEVVVKVRRCTRDELEAALKGIEGQQIVDVRETGVANGANREAR